jgi:hypothetical protein
MPTRSIPVDLLTTSYRIVGQLGVAHSGLMGMLSDQSCSFLEVKNASLARIHMATKLSEQSPNVRIVKNQAVAFSLARREEMGPLSTRGGSYARIFKFPLRVTTPFYEIEGTFEWSGRFDMTVIMDGTCDFVPLYDASLGAILFPSLLIQSPVILFNRRFLNTLVIANETSA